MSGHRAARAAKKCLLKKDLLTLYRYTPSCKVTVLKTVYEYFLIRFDGSCGPHWSDGPRWSGGTRASDGPHGSGWPCGSCGPCLQMYICICIYISIYLYIYV